ncbi:hypothetical protein ACLESO_56450, partial [Pyxidicoccus sp. 3LG]
RKPVSERARPSVAAARPEDPVPRVAVELVGGTAGGVVAGTLGLVAGYLVSAPTVGCDECRIVSLVGGFTGVLVGIPTGTWLGGKLMGGRGNFLSAAGGSLVGWGGALTGSLLLGADSEDDALAFALLVLPVVGRHRGLRAVPGRQPQATASGHGAAGDAPRRDDRARPAPGADGPLLKRSRERAGCPWPE